MSGLTVLSLLLKDITNTSELTVTANKNNSETDDVGSW